MKVKLFLSFLCCLLVLVAPLTLGAVSTTNVSYYKFDNDLEDTFFNVGALTPFGGGAVFNATNLSISPTLVVDNTTHYYEISNITDDVISQVRTVDFWLKDNDAGNGEYFFAMGKDPTDQNMFRLIDSGNSHQALVVKSNSVINLVTTSTTPCGIEPGRRKHIVVIFESNTTMSIYVNTEFCGRNTVGGNTFPDGDWNKIRINGRFDSAPGVQGEFQIDNLILSETIYTGDDINASYNNGLGLELAPPPNPFDISYVSPLNNSNLTSESVVFNFSTSGVSPVANDTCFITLNNSQIGPNISVVGEDNTHYLVSSTVSNGSYVWGVDCLGGNGNALTDDFNLQIHLTPEIELNTTSIFNTEQCTIDTTAEVLLIALFFLLGFAIILFAEIIGAPIISVIILAGLVVFSLFLVPCASTFGLILATSFGLLMLSRVLLMRV